MDVGRSCFKKWFQFFEPDPIPLPRPGVGGAFGLTTPRPLTLVRWYVAPPGAEPFPEGTIWGSSAFLDDAEKAQWQIGEYPYFQKYDKGATPVGIDGKSFCGKIEDFTEPAKWPSNELPLRRNAANYDLPTCCGGERNWSFVLAPIPPLCARCDGKIPLSYRVRIDAVGYPFDGLVVVVLETTANPDCQWHGSLTVGPHVVAMGLGWDPPSSPLFFGGFTWSLIGSPTAIWSAFNNPFTTQSCDPFGFAETMPILDSGLHPTGDYAKLTKI